VDRVHSFFLTKIILKSIIPAVLQISPWVSLKSACGPYFIVRSLVFKK
jgi:hypothetical protein